MTTNITIQLKRASKIYHKGEIIVGVVAIESSSDVRHEGLTLTMEGSVNLQLSSKNAGLFDAFSSALKPINLLHSAMELVGPGKIPAGLTEIPFELPLEPRGPVTPGYPGLLETYHGVFVNIMYTLKCTMKRTFLNKPLNTTCQFFVQHKQQDPQPPRPVRCEITPSSIRGAASSPRSMPHFQIYVELDSTVCPLDKPIAGKLRVDECSAAIKSIELQLVRVETVGSADAFSKDATEIQNIQVCCGDVARRRDLPLYAVLPRLFTCPTTAMHCFNIEFELNIAVIFEDDHLVTENFPILLLRSR